MVRTCTLLIVAVGLDLDASEIDFFYKSSRCLITRVMWGTLLELMDGCLEMYNWSNCGVTSWHRGWASHHDAILDTPWRWETLATFEAYTWLGTLAVRCTDLDRIGTPWYFWDFNCSCLPAGDEFRIVEQRISFNNRINSFLKCQERITQRNPKWIAKNDGIMMDNASIVYYGLSPKFLRWRCHQCMDLMTS